MYWISLYLYVHPPWEDILKNNIKPLCASLLQQKLIDGFFFIRYWENGPHIRLRLCCLSIADKERVEGIVSNYFHLYLTDISSSYIGDPISGSDIKTNALQFVAYEPEYKRYAGVRGVFIAEKHFRLSSETILEIICNYQSLEYGTSIAIAMELQVGLIASFDINLDDATKFFEYCFIGMELNDKEENTQEQNKDYLNKQILFYSSFIERSYDYYSKFISHLWFNIQAGTNFKETWMNKWINSNRDLFSLYLNSYVNGELDLSFTGNLLNDSFDFISSLIHMTNNRMGISSNDEILIAFILRQCLSNNSHFIL